MKEILIGKLLEYIRDNNPDILFDLEAKDKLRVWLYDKVSTAGPLIKQLKNSSRPEYIIVETCLQEITKELRPSRYNYILNILKRNLKMTISYFFNRDCFSMRLSI